MLQKVSDLDFDLSMSFKVKANGAKNGLPIYDFLLVPNNNYMFICNSLLVIATQKIFL